MTPITEFEEWTEEVTQMPAPPIVEDCASILDDSEIHQIKQWIGGVIEDLDDALFEKLFQFYLESGEMPYGTAKARTGDPYHWMFDRMEEEYGEKIQLSEEEESDEETVNIFETDWYREIKTSTKPGENLRIYRENHGLTQAKLGEMLGGIPRQHISNMERGTRAISLKTARKLAKLFRISVEKFV